MTVAPCDVLPQVDLSYAATGATVRKKGGFVHKNNKAYAIRANGGLVYFRATPATLSILDAYFERMFSQEESKRDDDQLNWNA